MEQRLTVECLSGALCSWPATPSSDLHAFGALFSQVSRQGPRELRRVVHTGSEQLAPTQLASLGLLPRSPVTGDSPQRRGTRLGRRLGNERCCQRLHTSPTHCRGRANGCNDIGRVPGEGSSPALPRGCPKKSSSPLIKPEATQTPANGSEPASGAGLFCVYLLRYIY